MPGKIRAGLLGISHAHAIGKLRTIQSSPEYELVGICEPNAKVQQRRKDDDVFKGVFASLSSLPRKLPLLSEQELLGDDTVQVVAVEGHVQDNLALARRAVEAGKHVHMDKPAGESLDEFKALLDLVKQKNLLFQMGYQFRYNTGFELTMKAVNEGWLGEIFFVHGSIGSTISPESRKELAFHPGGMMFELACHLIDTLVALLGRPQKVTPFMRHDAALDDQLADNTLAVFQFERAIAIMESAAMEIQAGQRRKLEICGTEGTVVVQPIEPPAVRLCLSQAHEGFQAGWQSVSVPNIPRYVRDFEELARCVRGEAQPSYSLEHDFIVQETLLRACGTLT